MVIAYVGSGGKTTQIMRRARECVQRGMKVLVTTSTRMYAEPDALLTDDVQIIIRRMEETGWAMAGSDHGEKMGPLTMETYLAACAHADVVLVEADGSKHMPLKFPAEYEPVICGLHGLGKPAKEVCHRLERVKACLGIGDETIIEERHIRKLLIDGYIHPLRARYPEKKITLLPVHDGSGFQMSVSRRIMEEL